MLVRVEVVEGLEVLDREHVKDVVEDLPKGDVDLDSRREREKEGSFTISISPGLDYCCCIT